MVFEQITVNGTGWHQAADRGGVASAFVNSIRHSPTQEWFIKHSDWSIIDFHYPIRFLCETFLSKWSILV